VLVGERFRVRSAKVRQEALQWRWRLKPLSLNIIGLM
jgi:hypothetical protein